MDKKTRDLSGFLIKQRAFIKMYIIGYVENGKYYGLQLKSELEDEFKILGYKPQHSEVYRAVHELMEDGILGRTRKIEEGSKYKELMMYHIADADKAKAYKELVFHDLMRCENLIKKAIKDHSK